MNEKIGCFLFNCLAYCNYSQQLLLSYVYKYLVYYYQIPYWR